ncbi:helix-turn-helix domain-containing protein [Paraburkholderia ginsengiterrae]|uniref:helix-turn-helix domain-containing protein n=1 Tax=Paraburkholderia ginsengiterrae TaxID=1462993 RepID=UPI001F619D0D|nr:helix-turn-helix domain-containing protein [Paraburkholderia ginsengiterrae]
MTDTASEIATNAEIAVSAYLSSALADEGGVNGADYRTDVGRLVLPDLLAVCTFLGGYACSNGAKPTKIANLDNVSVATAVANAAGQAFIDWPHGYHELLGIVCRNRGSEDSCARLTARFGYFYTALYKRFEAEQFEFLRREFDSFVSREWVGQLAERNRRLSPATRRRHAWISLTSAAKLLGIKRDTVSVLITQGTLEGQTHRTASGRTSGTVSRCSVEALRDEKAQWLTLTDVRKLLMISRKRAYALLRSSVLRPVGGPSVDGSPVWKFSTREVMALMSTLSDVASTAEHR